MQTFSSPGQRYPTGQWCIASDPRPIPVLIPSSCAWPRAGRRLGTGTDGAVSTVTLNRVSGIAQPDTAIVEVQTPRSTGEPVPDSGKRFIVIFQ